MATPEAAEADAETEATSSRRNDAAWNGGASMLRRESRRRPKGTPRT